jgi:signal transduction histidine kinase
MEELDELRRQLSLERAARQQAEETLRALIAAGQFFARSLNHEPKLRELLDQIHRLTQADFIIFYPAQPDKLFQAPAYMSGRLLSPASSALTRRSLGEALPALKRTLTEPIFASDISDSDIYTARAGDEDRLAKEEQVRSVAILPLNGGDQSSGVLSVNFRQKQEFNESQQHLIRGLAHYAVIMIRHWHDLHELIERQQAAAHISDSLVKMNAAARGQSGDYDYVMQSILESARAVANAEQGRLHLYEADSNQPSPTRVYEQLTLETDGPNTPATEGLNGIVAHVFRTKQPYLTSDAQLEPLYEGSTGVRSEIAVPLLSGVGEIIGVLSLGSRQPALFNEDTLSVLKLFAAQAVIAIQSARDYARLEEAVIRFSQLYDASWELAHITDLKQLDQAYDIVMQRADARQQSQVIITRFHQDAQELELVRSLRVEGQLLFSSMKIKDGVEGLVARTRETVVIHDTKDWEMGIVPLKPSETPINSVVVVPLEFEENYYGNLALSHKEANYFKGTDVELIRGLAKQLAITIYRLETAQARREVEKRIKEVEVMSSIGQSAFELSHRLGNDLGLIRFYVQTIREELASQGITSSSIEQHLQRILRDVGSVLHISQGFKQAVSSISEQPEKEVVPIKELLQTSVSSYPALPASIRIKFVIADDVVPALVVPSQVTNILGNLLSNAVEAMPEGGTITLRARNAGEYVEIEVEDTGPGIPPARQARIFDLFYSTKGSSGFGLWSARRNALENGGDLKVKSRPGKGAIFSLLLPAAQRRVKG